MRAHRPFRSLAAFLPLLALLACGPAAGSSSGWRGGAARLAIADGSLEVTLRPDRGPALRLIEEGSHRWVFDGPTDDLVGGSYSILLRNRTSERLKVVVGVDGLNVYGREIVAGSSSEDVGSILGPWSDRTLPGWQLDDARAQRFLWSPPEWSEGEGRTDSQIGLVTVQVYREWQEPTWEYHHRGQRDGSGTPPMPSEAPAAEPGSESASAAKPRSDGGGADAEVLGAQRRAPIGTASGDDVDHWVRTVRFVAATSFPESWAVIDYGRSRYGWRPPRPRWEDDLLGLDVAPDADGTRIVAVARGSAADRAGLEPHDVIVRIDTVSVPSPTATRRILRDKRPGEYAFLRVRRGPHELAVKIRT